jgi:hypothetical protein
MSNNYFLNKDDYKDQPIEYVVDYFLSLFKSFGICFKDDKSHYIMHMDSLYNFGKKDLYKINFYPVSPLTNKQFQSIINYLEKNFNLSDKQNYFTDQGDRFIIQVEINNFYRNLKLNQILN